MVLSPQLVVDRRWQLVLSPQGFSTLSPHDAKVAHHSEVRQLANIAMAGKSVRAHVGLQLLRRYIRATNMAWTTIVDGLKKRDGLLYRRVAISDPDGPSTPLWIAMTTLGGVWGCFAMLSVALAVSRPLTTVVEALVAAGLTQLIVQLVKRRVRRVRPTELDGRTVKLAIPEPYSFPSGHAATVLAIACTIAFANPALGSCAIIAALVAGFSRVRVGVHFPADVAFGQLIGAFAATAVHLLLG